MPDLIYKHRILSAVFLIWCMLVVSYVVWQTFSESPPNIPTGTAAALATVFGLPAVAVGLWKWRNERQ